MKITTKQGNEYPLETFNGAVYVRTPKGAFKVESLDYVTGKVTLVSVKGGFILATNRDKVVFAAAIDRALAVTDEEINAVGQRMAAIANSQNRPQTIGDAHKQLTLPMLDETALDESMASLEGICNGLR